jgi:hypothetical protein
MLPTLDPPTPVPTNVSTKVLGEAEPAAGTTVDVELGDAPVPDDETVLGDD